MPPLPPNSPPPGPFYFHFRTGGITTRLWGGGGGWGGFVFEWGWGGGWGVGGFLRVGCFWGACGVFGRLVGGGGWLLVVVEFFWLRLGCWGPRGLGTGIRGGLFFFPWGCGGSLRVGAMGGGWVGGVFFGSPQLARASFLIMAFVYPLVIPALILRLNSPRQGRQIFYSSPRSLPDQPS